MKCTWNDFIKPPRKSQGYQRYQYHTSGRGTIAIQMKKEKTTSVDKYIDDHRNHTSEHPWPVSSLLKGLIRQKDKNSQGYQRKTKLSNLTRIARLAWYLCIMSISKLCSPPLHCLIWFRVDASGCFCLSAWWVPWARMKSITDAHLCDSCDVVIVNVLVKRRCFLFFLMEQPLRKFWGQFVTWYGFPNQKT